MKLKVRDYPNAQIDIATEEGVFVASVKFRHDDACGGVRLPREEALALAREIVARFNRADEK